MGTTDIITGITTLISRHTTCLLMIEDTIHTTLIDTTHQEIEITEEAVQTLSTVVE